MRRVDELINDGAGNKLMHGVVGKVDELIHYGGVEKDDKLAQRQRGETR